jgi:cytochrome P450
MSLPEIDLLSPEVLADPFPHFNALREESPVVRARGMAAGAYIITRHKDVAAAAKGNVPLGAFSARYGQVPTLEPKGGLFSDPPDHAVYRRMLQPMHRLGAVDSLAPLITSIADELIGTVSATQEMDVYSDYAVPLPIRVIGHMLGVNPADFGALKVWSDQLVESINSGDPSANAAVRSAIHDYFNRMIEERESLLDAAGDIDLESALGTVLPKDAVSRLVIANRTSKPMTRELMTSMLRQQLKGGNETTTSLLTNVVWRLLQLPEIYDAVRTDPTLVEALIEESLRFDPPVLGLFRIVDEDVSVGGITIPAGARALLLWASANRDPRVWEDPDAFRIDRDLTELRRNTLTFGTGIHLCQGSPLARLEGRIGLDAILRRLPALRLNGTVKRVPTAILWGRSELPVTWSGA